MANPAIPADIESRWRPLTTAEAGVASVRLDDAWRKLQRDVPGIEDRFAADPDLRAEAVKVLADAVARLLRNGETPRKGSFGIDDHTRSWEYDETYSSSHLYFTDDELEGLTPTIDPRARAYSVMPS